MNTQKPVFRAQYGLVIDLDRCDGCGACMLACAVENNVPPAAAQANDRNGITWLRVFRLEDASRTQAAFIPMMCQQCGKSTPCESVCPQNAVETDQASGIVAQIPVRCLGCRYCMAACPYHARSFNWWDPGWPGQLAQTLNPDVSTRTRGVVEKCTFCSHRLQAARMQQVQDKLAASVAPHYTPACVEACPTEALIFGNLADPGSAVARLAHAPGSFRLLERLGT
ncbi:MAG: 4Fe-4S dicluster domain-containing protein, partial [Vicinamibacteria bacterium]|nr:4Fe-4S dicluster domain-containing protein [Vicinamibacteria bacterium]